MMVILTQKHGENCAIALLTPTNNFGDVYNQYTLARVFFRRVEVNSKWQGGRA